MQVRLTIEGVFLNRRAEHNETFHNRIDDGMIHSHPGRTRERSCGTAAGLIAAKCRQTQRAVATGTDDARLALCLAREDGKHRTTSDTAGQSNRISDEKPPKQQAAVGFEPTNNGFANRRLKITRSKGTTTYNIGEHALTNQLTNKIGK